jgi:hypothetical protein
MQLKWQCRRHAIMFAEVLKDPSEVELRFVHLEPRPVKLQLSKKETTTTKQRQATQKTHFASNRAHADSHLEIGGLRKSCASMYCAFNTVPTPVMAAWLHPKTGKPDDHDQGGKHNQLHSVKDTEACHCCLAHCAPGLVMALIVVSRHP